MPFYLQYLTTWPEYFLIKEAPDGTPMGYSEYVHTCIFTVNMRHWLYSVILELQLHHSYSGVGVVTVCSSDG